MPKLHRDIPVISLHCSTVRLTNEYGVLLFEDLRHKGDFYKKLGTEFDNLIIIECANSAVSALADLSSSLVVSCGSHKELLDILRGIPGDENEELSSKHLNTLIIENLSAFYWHLGSLHSQDKFSWYRLLNLALHVIRQKYGCNIIVTSWDIDFDRGFNARSTFDKIPEGLNDLTYLPSELFKGATRIIHYHEECLQLKDKKWQAITS